MASKEDIQALLKDEYAIITGPSEKDLMFTNFGDKLEFGVEFRVRRQQADFFMRCNVFLAQRDGRTGTHCYYVTGEIERFSWFPTHQGRFTYIAFYNAKTRSGQFYPVPNREEFLELVMPAHRFHGLRETADTIA